MKRKNIVKAVTLLLLTVLLLTSVSCGKKKTDNEIKVWTLNGTTGFGMAKLMEDAVNENTDKCRYSFTVRADASDVTAALLNGDADLAALPTNAAANLYQKSEGGIVVLAVNTLGCLYLVNTTGTPLSSFEDLRGKTVYAPAQNPTFIFTYLCRKNGLTPGTDLTVNSTAFAKPADLKDAVASGAVDYAVLPEPMVTIAKSAAKKAGKEVSVDFDLTEIWDRNPDDTGKLVQGCIVVRKEFLKKNEDAVEKFLASYRQSVDYLNKDPKGAAELIAKHGIFENAAVAEQAIPRCNVTFLDGEPMRAAMDTYLGILYQINPASVGNALPDDGFYRVKQ